MYTHTHAKLTHTRTRIAHLECPFKVTPSATSSACVFFRIMTEGDGDSMSKSWEYFFVRSLEKFGKTFFHGPRKLKENGISKNVLHLVFDDKNVEKRFLKHQIIEVRRIGCDYTFIAIFPRVFHANEKRKSKRDPEKEKKREILKSMETREKTRGAHGGS